MFERRFIKINAHNEREVLIALHELGYKWSSGQQILSDDGVTYTCSTSNYYISISEREKVILACIYINKEGYKKITLEELKKKEKSTQKTY